MPSSSLRREILESQHTARAITARLAETTSHSYLGDFVFGAIDGTVTTFAVVCGAAGAGLSSGVALVLGVANLLADGFSMAAGNYLSTKADRQVADRIRALEEHHIEHIPDGEREEVRQIYAGKGFQGELLEKVVDVITEDRQRWVDTMVIEEFGLQLQSPSPMRAAAATFVAFVIVGMVPLVSYIFSGRLTPEQVFGTSTIATAFAFFLIGLIKGKVVSRSLVLSGLETLVIGSAAALVAFGAGYWLRELVGIG